MYTEEVGVSPENDAGGGDLYRVALRLEAVPHPRYLRVVTQGWYTWTDDVRYKIRGAITDDLGQRSLFLLLLTAVVELTLYSIFKGLKRLGALALRRE